MATTGKVITCRAAVTWKVSAPYVVETVEIDPPKAGEVRVKMTSTGLCHSDVHFLEGCDKSYPFPTVLGHEGAGIIESVGSGVKSVVPGDLIVMVFERYCGDCASCNNPKSNMCRNQPRNHLQSDGTCRIKCKGQYLSQMLTVGTFSEYAVVSEMNVTKINQTAPANKIALAGCCIPTGYGAVTQCAKIEPGTTCAIWGLGGVGMNVVMGCRDSKASKIIGVDINSEKFKLAKEFGCTDVINPKQFSKSIPEVVAELTDGGADYCFVSVGSTEAMEEAFEASHPEWGQVILIGLTDIGEKVPFDVWKMLLGRKVKGTFYGSYKAKLGIPELVEKVIRNEIPLDKLVTHLIPLDKINEGFDMMKSGKTIRTIVDFNLKQ